MSSNIENFRPRLRSGRVIPQGSRIIFETDNPYNQIILPMGLADVILLCSGQFSVREIIEKIYKKQGSVPFRAILQAMHLLRQGGFFENGDELILNSHLHSWMEPRLTRWVLSWRFGQRIVADRRSPTAYYLVTLGILVGAILGLQMLPASTVKMLDNWMLSENYRSALIKLLLCSSLLQSARYLFRGIQVLLLTGKAYNVSLRLSFWGLYLHVGDEANDLFENRLYTAMFHISQIFIGWFFVFCLAPFVTPAWLSSIIILNSFFTFWELNPFTNSEGFKLLQSLLLSNNREIGSWHFDTSSLTNSLSAGALTRDRTFSRICAVWGLTWLVLTFFALHETAVVFGPAVLRRITHFDMNAVAPVLGLSAWLGALYYIVQSFLETIVVSIVQPWWRRSQNRLRGFMRQRSKVYAPEELAEKIKDLPIFSHFHEKNLVRIMEHSKVVEFREKSYVIMQGDVSSDLYVLLEGSVEVLRNSSGRAEWVSELSAVSVFGEAALLGDAPRAAEVKAKTHVIALKMPVSYIRQVAEESQVIRHLEDFRNAIMVNQFFASSPVFRSLSNESVEFLCSRGILEHYDENQPIFHQGDMADSLYMILRGSVDIEVHDVHVKTLRQGDFFGEIALIADLPRTATVRTTEPCVMFKISADSFWEILVQHLDLGIFLETVSEYRLIEDFKATESVKRVS